MQKTLIHIYFGVVTLCGGLTTSRNKSVIVLESVIAIFSNLRRTEVFPESLTAYSVHTRKSRYASRRYIQFGEISCYNYLEETSMNEFKSIRVIYFRNIFICGIKNK